MRVKGKVFGIEVEFVECSAREVETKLRELGMTGIWSLEGDGSLRPENGKCGEAKLYRPLTIKELKETRAIETLCDAIAMCGGKANFSCGLHIHFNAKRMKVANLVKIYKNFVAIDSALIHIFNIDKVRLLGNNSRPAYAKQNSKGDRHGLDTSRTIDYLSDRQYNRFSDRYMMLNLGSLVKHGTLEFRMFNGTVSQYRIWACLDFVSGIVRTGTNGVTFNEIPEPTTGGEIVDAYNLIAEKLKLKIKTTRNLLISIQNRMTSMGENGNLWKASVKKIVAVR